METPLVVGLGNPGSDYLLTRHNIGFLAIDHCADKLDIALSQRKFQGEYGRGLVGGCRVLLLKPQTYMNRSGECVARFQAYLKIAQQEVIIVHDDLDLEFGRIKITCKGGAGGHNGIRSLINQLGSPQFVRIKVGIGRPPRDDAGRGMAVERYVLSRFSEPELDALADLLPRVSEAIDSLIRVGASATMNEFNRR